MSTKTKWLVAPNGAIERYQPPPLPKLDADSRRLAYSRALARLAKFFEEAGFHCNSISHGENSISLEKSGFMFDVSIRRPMQVAYVTSHVGYNYEKRAAKVTPNIKTPNGITPGQVVYEPTATVKLMGEEVESEFAVQIICTSKEQSRAPIYVELDEDLPDPEHYVICNVLGVLRMVAATDSILQGIFEKCLENKSNVDNAIG